MKIMKNSYDGNGSTVARWKEGVLDSLHNRRPVRMRTEPQPPLPST